MMVTSSHALLLWITSLLLAGGGVILLLRAVSSRRAATPPYADPEILSGAIGAAGGRAERPAPATRCASAASGLSRSRRYCLITPCRDESRCARRTLDAVTSQTEPPARWIIVDDGSRDETPRILSEYAARFPYIEIVRRPDRGARKVGGGVVDAFYAGYDLLDPSDFEYICKLDLDLDLPPRYFELVLDWMQACPRIGACSGKPYFFDPATGEFPVHFPLANVAGLVSEKIGDEQAVGAIKFYRTTCFRQIGGFAREVMWDGIDGHRCRQLGWIAVSSDHPQLQFIHLRPMGTSHKNWWTGRVRHGFGQYYMGTTAAYMLASGLYRMTRPPRLVGGLAMLYGYFRSMARRAPRYGDSEFRRFLRSYQWECLLKGKATATAAMNERRAGRWQAARSGAGPIRAPA